MNTVRRQRGYQALVILAGVVSGLNLIGGIAFIAHDPKTFALFTLPGFAGLVFALGAWLKRPWGFWGLFGLCAVSALLAAYQVLALRQGGGVWFRLALFTAIAAGLWSFRTEYRRPH